MVTFAEQTAEFVAYLLETEKGWFINYWMCAGSPCRHMTIVTKKMKIQVKKNKKIATVVEAITPHLGDMPPMQIREEAKRLLDRAVSLKFDDDEFPPHEPWWYEDSTVHPGMVSELLLKQELKFILTEASHDNRFFSQIFQFLQKSVRLTDLFEICENVQLEISSTRK